MSSPHPPSFAGMLRLRFVFYSHHLQIGMFLTYPALAAARSNGVTPIASASTTHLQSFLNPQTQTSWALSSCLTVKPSLPSSHPHSKWRWRTNTRTRQASWWHAGWPQDHLIQLFNRRVFYWTSIEPFHSFPFPRFLWWRLADLAACRRSNGAVLSEMRCASWIW